ncbi:MAG: metal ABC transporter permease [Armatimonadetes bacterium]|nr:metal ABC transporter permease [Armatimonadota bacterium]
MGSAGWEVQLVAVTVAAACALPGTFLVLRRMAMMSDAISHAILLGIVLAFFVVHDLGSPWLVLAAAATGVATVWLVEVVHRTNRVREDAAMGLVFPVLFSLGVILISRYAGNVHLDTDAVLLGEIAFAPFNQLEFGGRAIGPRAFYTMAAILAVNLLFVALFFKELKLATFDPGLAAALGFSPPLLHYALMALVSLTAVGAFDAVGSVLVVALMIAPPAAATLLTDRLRDRLLLSVGLAVFSALAGYHLAMAVDVSIAGMMATMTGVVFLLAWLLAPEQGLLAAARRRRRQRLEFAQAMLLVHLLQHEDRPEAVVELAADSLPEHLRWEAGWTQRVAQAAEAQGWIARDNGHWGLTPTGRALARGAVVGETPRQLL